MHSVLLTIHLLVTIALVLFILAQKSSQDGMGLSGGNALFTGSATANFLTRTTAILAAVFMALSLVLGIMAARGKEHSILDKITTEQPAQQEAPKPAPAVPLAQ